MIRLLLILGLMLAPWATAQATQVKPVVSPGGIQAWLVEDHTIPILSLEMLIAGGAAADSKAGLAHMVSGLLDEGAGPLDSQAFQTRLEDLAVSLSFHAGRDHLSGSLKTLTANRSQAFDLLRLALTAPRFDPEPVERVRGQILASLAQASQKPDQVAARAWYQTAFAGHAYGRPTQGDPDTIKAISIKDIRAYARTWITREDMIIGVVGDITPADLAVLLDQTFGALPARHPAGIVPPTSPKPFTLSVIPRSIPQSVALFGAPGPKRDDADWYVAYVMNHILGGGGFSSWLTEEVREKRGLAYSVGSYLAPMEKAGLIVGQVATQNARMADSIALIRQQWSRMAETGPTQTELDDALTYIIGSFALQMDSTSGIASLLVAMQRDKLGMDYLDRRADLFRAITLDDIRRVAKRLLYADSLSFVVVGQPDGLTTPTGKTP